MTSCNWFSRAVFFHFVVSAFTLSLGLAASGVSAAPPEIAPKSNLIRAQATADEVYSAQERQLAQTGLNALGYAAGTADGVFGPGTRTAIRQYQQATGQSATGFLTRLQYAQLMQVAMQAQAEASMQVPAAAQPATGQGATQPPAPAPSIAALARELGIPVKDGYLVAKHPQMIVAPAPSVTAAGQSPTAEQAWARLEALVYLGMFPDTYRQGELFVSLAALLLQGDDFASFFPDPGQLNRALARGGLEQWRLYDVHPFGDEFAYVEKRQEFFERYFDQLLAKVPEGPIPMMHVVPLRVGTYDMDAEAFPLSIVLTGRQAALHVAAFPNGDPRVLRQIASSDLIENIPDRLALPFDAARALNGQLGSDSTIYLGWTSTLEFGVDVDAPRTTVGDFELPQNVKRGRAQIVQAGLYRDPQLTQLITLLEPETLTSKAPAPVAPAPEAALNGDAVDISKVVPATGEIILQQAARSEGPGFARQVANNAPSVRRASELDRAALAEDVIAELTSQPPQEIWLQGSANVGVYNLQSSTFDLRSQTANHFFSTTNRFGTRVNVQLREPVTLDVLQVPGETARYIIENLRRQITTHLLVEIERVALDPGGPVQVFVQPKAIAYSLVDPQSRQPVLLAAKVIAPSAPRDAVAEDFTGQDVPFNMASAGLLYAHELPDTNRAAFLDGLMPIVWKLETEGNGLPGAQFFRQGDQRPTPAIRAAFAADFAQWAAAKATAIRGAQFVLTDNGGYADQQCLAGQSSLQSTNMARSPFGQALALQQIDADRRQAQRPGPFAVIARDVLHYTASPGNKGQPCRFSNWNVFAEITRPAVSDGEGGRRQIVATLNEVRLTPGAASLQDALFRFEGIETRFFPNGVEAPSRVIAATGPTAAEQASAAQAAQRAALFAPRNLTWSGAYQCDGGAARGVLTLEFRVLSANRLSATATYSLTTPSPETGSFYLEGTISENRSIGVADFRLNEGRWIYNGNGRPVPQFSGRFVDNGAALDIRDDLGACFGFDLRPGRDNGAAQAAAASGAQGRATADTGAQPAPVVTPSDRDVVGVRTGMSLAEAQEVLLSQFRVAAVYETQGAMPGELPAMSYMRVFIMDKGSQTVTLMSSNRNGPVVGVNRQAVRFDGAFDYAGLAARLSEKYGAASDTAPEHTTHVWAGAAACGPLVLQPMPRRNFTPLQGVSSGGAMPAQLDLQYAVSDIPVLSQGSGRPVIGRPDCGQIVQFEGKTYAQPRAGASVFHVFMVDIPLVRQLQGITEVTPEAGAASQDGDEIKL